MFLHLFILLVEFNEHLTERLRGNALNIMNQQRYLKWLQNSGLAYMNNVELAGEASRIVRTGELNMPDVFTSQPLVGYEETCEDVNLDAYDPTGSENYNYFLQNPNDLKQRDLVLIAQPGDENYEPRLGEFKAFLEKLYNIPNLHFITPPEIAARHPDIEMPDSLLYFLFEGYTNFGHSLDLFRSSSATWFGAGLLSKDLQRVHLYRYDARHPQRVYDYLSALDKPFPVDAERHYNGIIPALGIRNRFLNYKYFNNLRDWNLFRFEYRSLNETLNLPFRDIWSTELSPEPIDCEKRPYSMRTELYLAKAMGPVTEAIRSQPNYPSMSLGQGVANAKLAIYPWAFTEAARLELPLLFAQDPAVKASGAAKNHFARFGTTFALLDPDADSYALLPVLVRTAASPPPRILSSLHLLL